mgnify:CR=1 FL=1
MSISPSDLAKSVRAYLRKAADPASISCKVRVPSHTRPRSLTLPSPRHRPLLSSPLLLSLLATALSSHTQVLRLALEEELGVNLTQWKGTIKSAAVEFMQQMQA